MKGILPRVILFQNPWASKRPPWSYRAIRKTGGAAVLTLPNMNWVLASPEVSKILLKYSTVFYKQSTLLDSSRHQSSLRKAHKPIIQDSVLHGLLFSDSMIVYVIGPEMAGYWSQMSVNPWLEMRLEKMYFAAFYQAKGKEASLHEASTLPMCFPHIPYLT